MRRWCCCGRVGEAEVGLEGPLLLFHWKGVRCDTARGLVGPPGNAPRWGRKGIGAVQLSRGVGEVCSPPHEVRPLVVRSPTITGGGVGGGAGGG